MSQEERDWYRGYDWGYKTDATEQQDQWERAMAGEDNDEQLGPLHGFWFIIRFMITTGMFAALCFDLATHWSRGTWEAGFVQFVSWAGFAATLNTIPRWRDKAWIVFLAVSLAGYIWTMPGGVR